MNANVVENTCMEVMFIMVHADVCIHVWVLVCIGTVWCDDDVCMANCMHIRKGYVMCIRTLSMAYAAVMQSLVCYSLKPSHITKLVFLIFQTSKV